MSKEYTLKSSNVGVEAVKSKIIQELNERISARQDCKVTIGKIEVEKTPKQLRGEHRLCGLIASQLREWGNMEYNKDVVKQIVKIKCGFVKDVGGTLVTRSFKTASLVELKEIIEFTTSWGQVELGIKDCYLTSQEQVNINNYYN